MYTMKESVAVAKEADAKKRVSPTRSDKSIHRVRDEPERQLGSLRDVIVNIRRDGGKPSVENIATELSSMHSAERAPALLALQQTHGNRYVQRVVAGIQAKLKVGQPGDIYEQEADRVADEVMKMPEPQIQSQAEEEERKKKEEELIQTKPISEQITLLIQRQVEEEEEEQEEGEEIIQTKQVPGQTLEITPDIESRIESLKGGGQPLPKSARNFFEDRFGYDFSQVRVHTDSDAVQMNRELNAQAFTYGRSIYFGAGRYSPDTSSDKRLLAHELTHVVQQTHDEQNNRNCSLNDSQGETKPAVSSSSPEPILFRYVSPEVGSQDQPLTPFPGSVEISRTDIDLLYGPSHQPLPSHVEQGAMGNCWFLAALSSLASTQQGRSHIIAHIRPNREQPPSRTGGPRISETYTVTLYHGLGGEPLHYRMSPSFPPDYASPTPGQLGHPSPRPIIWVALYERALAHQRGDYDALNGLSGVRSCWAIKVLTGEDCREQEITTNMGMNDLIDIWQSMWNALHSRHVPVVIATIGNTTYCTENQYGKFRPNHAYTVRRLYTNGDERLIRVYNPHGSRARDGPWRTLNLNELRSCFNGVYYQGGWWQ